MAAKRINVVWFKCTDLRTHDHAALKAAHAEGLPVLHLYVFDPFWHANTTRICKFPKTGVVRTRFQLEALSDLAARLKAVGHSLCTRSGVTTAQCFQELCADYHINAVFGFNEICSEELSIERKVRDVLRRNGQGPLKLFWGFELYHRDDLKFNPSRSAAPFRSYTAFRKSVEENCSVRSTAKESPKFLKGDEFAVPWARADDKLPDVATVMGSTYEAAADAGEKMDPRAELRWTGGESAALERVKDYLWTQDSLGLDYVGATMTMDTAKSCMRDKAMSKLSPWLAHGCLSPRLLYEEVKRYERERKKNKSTYWITHELLWRDFVRFGSIHAGTSIFKIGGLEDKHPRWQWSSDDRLFKAWKNGQTGFPFVDCFMRELQVTGYSNHMGRECSGWFLIGDLGLDWRMGAEWFESILIDYEPTANWYNWAYRCLPAAGRGGPHGFLVDAPGHRLQGVEILKWGTQHDPDATYIKRWIPELASLEGTIAREPWRLGLNKSSAHQEMAGSNLRPVPDGSFDVSRTALQTVLAMGFPERDAAIALHRARNDPDTAIALLLGEIDSAAAVSEVGGDNEDDLARAIALSMEQASPATKSETGPIIVDDDTAHAPAAKHGGFCYGKDYPHPVIEPVSIRGTEEQEAKARTAQADRDRQINAAKRRRPSTSTGKEEFSKDRWEHSRQQWPAETPTGAERRGVKASGKGEGRRGHDSSGGRADDSKLQARAERFGTGNGQAHTSGKDAAYPSQDAASYYSGQTQSNKQTVGADKKRRWNAKNDSAQWVGG